MKKYFIILLVLLFEKAISQVGINFSSTFVSDDNVFKNPFKSYSNISSSNASVFYNRFTENSQLKFSYGLNLNSYNSYSTANNNTNLFELDYALGSADEEQLFSIALSYSGKSVNDEYKLYEEKNLNLHSGYDFSFNDIHSGNIRYGFNKITYDNFSDFSYSENILGYTSNITWQTKTSLFLDVNLGYKIYSNPLYSISNDSIISNPGMMNGKGKMKNIIGIVSNTTKLDDGNVQLLLTGKIAQSLYDNLGAYLAYSFRYNLENNSRSIMISDYYFSDDNLFDDNYGYGGHDLEMGFTYIMPLSLTLKSSFEYTYKKYANEYPDIIDSLKERNDDKLLFNIRLSRSFELFESLLNKLNVYLSYVYTNNSSNINLFNYTNNIFALGINTTLNF